MESFSPIFNKLKNTFTPTEPMVLLSNPHFAVLPTAATSSNATVSMDRPESPSRSIDKLERLIPAVNKLQNVFATVGAEKIQLPQIIVVGSQSSGKSSVLEAIVGRDFLPRGSGIVTRRPLILQLQHVKKEDAQARNDETAHLEEWGEFLHAKDQIFGDFEAIRDEIMAETARIAGSNKCISNEPISLKIYSHRVVDLTLVDLPGITKVPVGDQPLDIERQINKLIMEYIRNPNSIILAVTPANTDFATSEAIKLAREVDLDGSRTLAVITKLDLMDAGTDASDVLNGNVIPIKLGIIGVVNRSQQDIADQKKIKKALKDEIAFFERKYPTLAAQNGTSFLAATLSRLLMDHIHACLPDLKNRVALMTGQFEAKLATFGTVVEDQSVTILDIFGNFRDAYIASIMGTEKVQTESLGGGARISYIFQETFQCALSKIDPLAGLSKEAILNARRNASGTRPGLSIPELAFEVLIKEKIKTLQNPALQCVSMVAQEMEAIFETCGLSVKHRFPVLYRKIMDVARKLLCQCLEPANEMVKSMIQIQLAYINTKHPDFEDVHHAEKMIKKDGKMKKTKKGSLTVKNAGEQAALFSGNLLPLSGKQNSETSESDDEELTNGDQTARKQVKVSRKEDRDCRVIKRLLDSYFSIVRKSIQDEVPKTIMYYMVNKVQMMLYNALMAQLYKQEKFDELLAESEDIAKRRQETLRMLEALHQANVIIGEIKDTQIW